MCVTRYVSFHPDLIILTASQYNMVPLFFCLFSTLFANAVVHSSFAEKMAVLNSLRALRSLRRLSEEGVIEFRVLGAHHDNHSIRSCESNVARRR